jgi:hypothetical protein
MCSNSLLISKKRALSLLRANKIKESNFKVNFSSSVDMQVEVDRILDKINEQGFGTLTEKEKQTLEKAKGLLKN